MTPKNEDAAVAAIRFAVDHCGLDAREFLHCWMYGDFDAIRSEWPEAPEAVFIGSEPLHRNANNVTEVSCYSRDQTADAWAHLKADVAAGRIGLAFVDGKDGLGWLLVGFAVGTGLSARGHADLVSRYEVVAFDQGVELQLYLAKSELAAAASMLANSVGPLPSAATRQRWLDTAALVQVEQEARQLT